MACLVVGGPVVYTLTLIRAHSTSQVASHHAFTRSDAPGREIRRRPWSPIGRSRIVLARATETAQTYTQGAHIMEVRPTLVGGALVFGVVVLLAAPRTSAASAASGPELEVD